MLNNCCMNIDLYLQDVFFGVFFMDNKPDSGTMAHILTHFSKTHLLWPIQQPRPLLPLSQPDAPAPHQKAPAAGASYANNGADKKSTVPAEESRDGIMMAN